MFRGLFRGDSPFWKPFGFVADLLVLSVLWLLCSLPLVTLGGAAAALYDAVVHGLRRKEPDYLSRFFQTFRQEWKHGVGPTLLWGGILGALYAGFRWFTGHAAGDAAVMTAVGLLVLLCIPLGIACWVFPLLSRFTLDFRTLNGNAARLALGKLPITFLLALSAYGCLWVTVRFLFLPLLLLPAALMLAWSYLLEPVFRSYEG